MVSLRVRVRVCSPLEAALTYTGPQEGYSSGFWSWTMSSIAPSKARFAAPRKIDKDKEGWGRGGGGREGERGVGKRNKEISKYELTCFVCSYEQKRVSSRRRTNTLWHDMIRRHITSQQMTSHRITLHHKIGHDTPSLLAVIHLRHMVWWIWCCCQKFFHWIWSTSSSPG